MKEEAKIKETGAISVLVPFLVGGLVGAGVMLLYAPKAGREIRRDLTNSAIKTRDQIMSVVDKGKELYEESRSAVTDVIDAGKTAFLKEKERHSQAA